METYLVTGGAGFIGSHLCDELIKTSKVYVLDNLSTGFRHNLPKGVELIEGDICDYPLVEELMSKVDGCFHLAAMVSVPLCNDDVLKAHHINLTGTLNILKSAYKVSKRIPVVFASSCAVYGNCRSLPIQETAELSPISIYATTKLAGEYYGRFINELHHLPFTALRLFNVYGPRQVLDSSYSGVISIFLNALLHDQPCVFFGSGKQLRDFIFVKDVVQFFINAMLTSTDTARMYNVCTGRSTDIKTIAVLLSQILGKELKVDHKPPKIGDIIASLGSPLFAEEELAISAQIPIELGLSNLVHEVVEENL
ncbi:NAD-dependent epimerase/dehydratase family protein [Legionella sp.]|uniref:NAD-dependent epimerase/dehydratase family protein n=1 Tax=Legionella sp. TaxID=459 RepID=UPI000CAF9CC2|nr:NAD-dependent epimerase/dehydratase family protein [Legionella sp.]PJE16631.1 MAG: epimerase [Legionella sp.]